MWEEFVIGCESFHYIYAMGWKVILVYGKSSHQLRLCSVIAIKIESI